MSRRLKEDGDEVPKFSPHPDWKKNYAAAQNYISLFPKELLFFPFANKEVMYSIDIEKGGADGFYGPFIFWITTHKKDLPSRAFPLSLHIGSHDFMDKVKKHFPFPKLLEEGIEYKQSRWWDKN